MRFYINNTGNAIAITTVTTTVEQQTISAGIKATTYFIE
jgi:hypothetical protein